MSAPSPGFGLRVERVRLRAIAAVERGRAGSLGADAEVMLAANAAALRDLPREARDADARMGRIAATLELDDDEVELVWTAVAAATEPRLAAHLDALGARGTFTLAVHAILSGNDGDRGRKLGLAMSADHALVTSGLLELGDAGVAGARSISASRRLARHLAGDDQLDDEVAAIGGMVTVPAEVVLSPAQQAGRERLAEALAVPGGLVILLEGAAGSGRRTVAAMAARAAGREVCAIELTRLPPTRAAVERALRALRRECTLRNALPVVAGLEDLRSEDREDERTRSVVRAFEQHPGTIVATTADAAVDLPLARRVLRLRWPAPDVESRRTLWRLALGAEAAPLGAIVDAVANRFRLGPAGIGRAVEAARLLARARRGTLDEATLVGGVRNDIIERLGSLALRVEVRQSWDDLVLGADTMDQIKTLTARVRHAHKVYEDWRLHEKVGRATGVAALFSGPPGTGKTMVAGLIARDLDLDLYQIDLSKVVSKWVGETEKQLSRIFDAAATGHALLLFDEADSLFAKRTEVKSSVDRYANLEVNYLLQRIEAFNGVTVLTTNLETSIDPALRRRLAGHVVFWPPDEHDRTLLWERFLSAGAPKVADLDLEELAVRFPDMTGANIRNAALGAAFLAAAEDRPIDQPLLERAARAEYVSMGRLLGQRK